MRQWSKGYRGPPSLRHCWWLPLQWHGYEMEFCGWKPGISRDELMALPDVADVDALNVPWTSAYSMVGHLSHPGLRRTRGGVAPSWEHDPEVVSVELISCSLMIHCVLIASGLTPEPTDGEFRSSSQRIPLVMFRFDKGLLSAVPQMIAGATKSKVEEIPSFARTFNSSGQLSMQYFALKLRKRLGSVLLLSGAGMDADSGSQVDWVGCTYGRPLLHTRRDDQLIAHVSEVLIEAGGRPLPACGWFPPVIKRW